MGLGELFANNALVKLLRGDTSRYDLIASMVGTRLGDRMLVVGGGDGRLVAAVGAGSGLTGRICAVERDSSRATAVEQEATAQGVLVEVEASASEKLPYDAASFDVSVMTVEENGRVSGLDEVLRVLRPGGRCVVLVRAKVPAGDAPVVAFKEAGFRAARLIAERSGFAFYEAVKSGAA